VRLADMGDPRVPVTEGEGPNTIEDVAGEVDGVVYFSDCCEPVAGDVRAATGPDTVEALGFGSSVALSPDRTQLATLNTFGLGVLNLTTGTSTFRSFDTGQPFINPWDVIWSADGRELVVLAFDENGGALHRFSVSESLDAGDVIPIGVGFDPARPPGAQFAGHEARPLRSRCAVGDPGDGTRSAQRGHVGTPRLRWHRAALDRRRNPLVVARRRRRPRSGQRVRRCLVRSLTASVQMRCLIDVAK
jgi:hypothetical protein